MKKYIVILFVAILSGLQSTAQMPDNKGQYTVFLNHDYDVTLNDVTEVATGMPTMATKGYKLSNGEKFYVYYPEVWVSLMTQILSEVKGSPVTAANIADELATGVIVNWNDDISARVRDYAVTNGKPWILDENYNGAVGVKVLIYRGYPVLKIKTACFNPLWPKIISKGNYSLAKSDTTVTMVNGQPVTFINNNYTSVVATGGSVTNSGNNDVALNGGPDNNPNTSDYNEEQDGYNDYSQGNIYPHGRYSNRYNHIHGPGCGHYQTSRYGVIVWLSASFKSNNNRQMQQQRPQQQRQRTRQNNNNVVVNHASGTSGRRDNNVPSYTSGTRGRRN